MAISRSTSSVILSAVTTTWIQHTIQAVSGLIVLPLLVSHLGKTEFGIWILVGQTISFFALSDLGVASATGRFIAHFRGADDRQTLQQLYSTVLALMIAAGMAVFILTLILSSWVPSILGIDAPYHNQAKLIFIIGGIALALQFPLRTGIGILTGHQLYGPHAIGKITGSIFNLAGILILLGFKSIELVPVAFMNAAAILSAQILLMVVAWKMTRPWSLKLSNISLPLAKDILSMGGSSLIITLSNLGYRSGLGIAVGRLLSVEAAGIYGVCLTVISHLQPLISSLSTPFITLASEWQARNHIQHLRRISNLVMRITVALSASMAAGLFIYGETVLQFLLSSGDWLISDFSIAGKSLSIMGLGLAIGLPQMISQSTLRGVGRYWQVSYAYIAISILSLVLGILAIMTGFGIYGAALGWCLFWVFQGVFFFPVMICRYLQQSIREMITYAYLPGMGVGLFVLILAGFFSK